MRSCTIVATWLRRIPTRRRVERCLAEGSFAPTTSGDVPRLAVRHVEPARVAHAADKICLLRVPLHLLAMVIREVDEVADDDGVRAHFDVANRSFPAVQTRQPVALVIVTLVELDFGVGQILRCNGVAVLRRTGLLLRT